MARKVFSVEQIISMLRQVEVELSQGKTQEEACRGLGISVNTYGRWRRQYGGMKLDEAKRLKLLEQENSRLKRLVAELSLDNQVLKEFNKGKY